MLKTQIEGIRSESSVIYINFAFLISQKGKSIMKLIDTHAHLYAAQFDDDREEMLQRARKAGIAKIYLPNIDSQSIQPMLALEKIHPGYCIATMGLHPCSVGENVNEELAVIEKWLATRSFAAIGEIGIDLYWETKFMKEQEDAFVRQLEWAKELNIPIIIHARESLDILINLVEKRQKGNLKGVFHCFTGDTLQAQRIIDSGFFLGIGGVLTFKKSGLDKVVKDSNRDWIVLETDAPYLAPTPFRGKRNESAHVKVVAEKLSGIWEIPTEEVASITTKNAENLFG